MSKRSLIYVPAVEGFDPDVVTPESDDQDFDAAMITAMEDEQNAAEKAEEFGETDDVLDEADASVERLDGLCKAIVKHGISAPMMEAVDPDDELVDAGICCAYEELGTVPMKDTNAQAAIEGINTALYTIHGRMGEFFANTGTMLSMLSDANMRAIGSYESVLTIAGAKFEGAEFEAERFNVSKLRTLKKEDFKRACGAVSKMLNILEVGGTDYIAEDMDAFLQESKIDSEKVMSASNHACTMFDDFLGDKESLACLGMRIEANGDKVAKVHRIDHNVKEESGTAEELGWQSESACEAVLEASALMKAACGLGKVGENVAKMHLGSSMLMKARLELKDQDITDEDKEQFDGAIESSRNIMTMNKVMLIGVTTTLRKIGACATQLAKANLMAVK